MHVLCMCSACVCACVCAVHVHILHMHMHMHMHMCMCMCMCICSAGACAGACHVHAHERIGMCAFPRPPRQATPARLSKAYLLWLYDLLTMPGDASDAEQGVAQRQRHA